MEGVRKVYAERINQDVAGEGIYDRLSKIRRVQNLFKPGGVPVYLLGKRDPTMYRGVMIATLFGLAFTFTNLTLLATGKLTRKTKN